MKVWILLESDWNGLDIIGVFADRDVATAVKNDYEAKNRMPNMSWSIDCHEVEEVDGKPNE